MNERMTAAVALLNEKLAESPTCTACGRDEWHPGQGIAAVLESKGLPDTSVGLGFEAVPLICTYCGYVHLHALSVLQGRT